MNVVERAENYWYFSRRYAQLEIISSLINSMVEDERTVSEKAQNALRKLNKARADCQSRIGKLNLSGAADCQACQGRCCDSPSDEYFSPVDYWLRKFVEGGGFQYSSRAIRKPSYYIRQRSKHFAHIFRAIPDRILGRSTKRKFPTAAIRYQRAAMQRPGCQFLNSTGCALSYTDRPIRCVMYACPRLIRGLKQPVRSQYTREVGALYRIAIATLKILNDEVNRPSWWDRTLLKLIP